MHLAFGNRHSLIRPQFDGPVLQLDVEPARDDIKELIVVVVFMPMEFAMHDTEANDTVIDLRQGLVEPLVGAFTNELINVDALLWCELDVQVDVVVDGLFHITSPLELIRRFHAQKPLPRLAITHYLRESV